MADVAVRRLRIRGPAERAPLAAFFVEDGCRTALAETNRLVLLRRLRLPAAAVQPRPFARNAAIAKAWEAATARARHGGSDRAEESDCVWFASREEARRLFLALLLAGRRPSGWFWRLAVPEWEELPAERLIVRLVGAAMAERDGAAFPRLALQIVEAGRTDLLLQALARSGRGPRLASASPPFRAEAVSGHAPTFAPERATEVAAAAATLAAVRTRLPSSLREAAERLALTLGPRSSAAALLLEGLLLQASPDLRLSRTRLSGLVEYYVDLLSGKEWIEAPRPARIVTSTEDEERETQALPEALVDHEDRSPLSPETPLSAAVLRAPRQEREQSLMPEQAGCERFSAAAGLWLVLPSLIRLGWREWLLGRPELIGTDPGRTLIAALAAHHRVAPDDPALDPLSIETPPPPPDWADAWRRALRHALRRNARLRLSRLIWKPGRIAWADDRLFVRFPPAAADLRLRRRALDVDPGWVDWLGFSVRYLYSDEPVR